MPETATNQSITARAMRLFLIIFVPLFVIVAGISLAYYLSEKQESIQTLQQQEKFQQKMQVDVLKHEFEIIVSDLITLSAHQQLHLIVDDSKLADYAALANEFLSFCRNRKLYDQVRYLDATGMERVRVNYNQGQPEIAPNDQLQSKAGRYYFKDTFSLEKGEIFVSPFDLNVEMGAIERPFKPTLRFGIPVFNSRGGKRGILILNYLGNHLIEQLHRYTHPSFSLGFDMLIDQNGYFLKGMRSEDEWGFMLPDRKDRVFSKLFPAQWHDISQASSGQFLDERGAFTFTSVFPLAEGLKSSTGSPEAFGSSANKYFWHLVSFTPYDAIREMTAELRDGLLYANLAFGLLAGIGLWFMSIAIVKRQAAEVELERMAHFDLLTELPNRPLLYDRMSMALAHAHREKNLLAVLFLDLDGFKGVNDELGHEAGDQTLIEIAHRLKQCVRETDTVARLGGDEFVLLLTSITEPEAAGSIATKVIKSLSKPIMLKNQQRTIGASIGITVYPIDGETQDALLSKADNAMYSAKANGKNHYRFYS